MKKHLVCLIALTFAFMLAACGGAPAADVAGTQAISAEHAATEGTTIEMTITEETTTEGMSTADASSIDSGESPPVPTDTAGIIRYYNEALAKTDMQRISYKRSMTKITGFAKALGITILDEPDLQDNPDVMPYVHDKDNAIRPSDLAALNADWVADAKSTVRGSDAVLTIAMRNHAVNPDLDPKPGVRGYVSTLDRATVEPLVCEVSMALAAAVISPNALKEVNVTNSSFGLSDGKYSVVIDISTGKIKSLTFTASQQVEGNAKCVLNIPLIPASANALVTLRGNLTAVYAPK